MKILITCLLCLLACSCTLAQSAIPAGADRFKGQTPAMPTEDQIVTTEQVGQALQPTPASIARLKEMTPRMPEPHEIVTDVPPTLRKQTFGTARPSSPSEQVQEDQPLNAIPPANEEKDHSTQIER